MKKVTALLLAMGMVVSLVGCGSKTEKTSKTEDPTPTTAQAAATEAPEATEAPKDNGTGEKVDLTMWCIATESDSNRHAYEAATEDFKAAHPEINFTWEATENEAYKTKIKAAASANEMPDIFFTWGCGFLKEFVDGGRVYCLDEAYAKYANELPQNMTANHSVDGKLYAAPTTFNIVALFANMDLLKQAGYDEVPKTYDDLMKCCDALIAKGITPFGCSGKEPWAISEYVEPMIEKSVGAKAMYDMYTGTTKWNNDGVIDAITKFQDMISKKYFDPNDVALGNDEVKQNFMAGKYAFYMNGTWNCADFSNAGLADKVKVSEFPVINESASQLGELIGGANDSLAVSAGSKNAAVAAEAALELSKSICHYGYLDGNGLPAWTPDYDVSTINPLTVAVSDIVKTMKQNVLFGDNLLSANDAQTYLDYVTQAYGSAVDGKAYAEGLDNDLKY